MRTLQEHFDDLDRMIDGGADKPKLRSQVAFINREVAALEADYSSLTDAHAQLKDAHAALEAEHTALKRAQSDTADDALTNAQEEDCTTTYYYGLILFYVAIIHDSVLVIFKIDLFLTL